MFPGASFHRIGGSLDLLQTRSEVESLIIDTNAKSLLQNVAGYNMEIISKDVHLLASKYLFETDHEARLVYSSYIRRTNDPIAIQSVRTVIENHYSSLLDSINAADQESGALLARLSFTLLNDVATQDMQATAAECKHVPNLVAYIQYLVEKLDSNVRVAVENISFSSQKYPLNGWLSSIRNTLEVQFQQKDIWKSDGPWYDLLLRIGNLGLRACQCVLEVCSNESPEGNMPASFREIHENIELGITEASQLEDTGAIAQIVLRHCFRVVKEATDCLLSIIISIPKEYLDRFMPLCLTFGSLLCKLISTVRHRGAIGAAQVNFAKLCSYFISCGNQELRMIPRRWLDDFLGQIQDLEISVTRRSAGLPMAILSVINSPPSAHEKSNYLRFAVEQLLEMFDSDLNIRKEQMDLAEVHALNVLRYFLVNIAHWFSLQSWLLTFDHISNRYILFALSNSARRTFL